MSEMSSVSGKKKKRLVAVGIACALAAGVGVGGAFVTTNSTIFDNIFQGAAYDPNVNPADGELVVTGAPMSHTFSGMATDERVRASYTVTNTATNGSMRFDLGSQVHLGGTNADALAGVLNVRVSPDNGVTWLEAGTLGAIDMGGVTKTLAAGESTYFLIEVYVGDVDQYRAAGLEAGAEVTVDYLFDSIFTNNAS